MSGLIDRNSESEGSQLIILYSLSSSICSWQCQCPCGDTRDAHVCDEAVSPKSVDIAECYQNGSYKVPLETTSKELRSLFQPCECGEVTFGNGSGTLTKSGTVGNRDDIPWTLSNPLALTVATLFAFSAQDPGDTKTEYQMCYSQHGLESRTRHAVARI